MAWADFFSESGQRRAAGAIRDVEAQTSAEIVMLVKPMAGRYREADYLVGGLLAFAALIALLYAPWDFVLHLFPLITVLAFVTGTVVSALTPSLRRVLLPRGEARRAVYQAARAAFVDLKIARTSGRWGVLVLVAALERRVEVVTDLGIDVKALGAPWQQALATLQAAVERGDFEGFLGGLAQLGPVLGAAIPRRLDDVDELPDQVVGHLAGHAAGEAEAAS